MNKEIKDVKIRIIEKVDDMEEEIRLDALNKIKLLRELKKDLIRNLNKKDTSLEKGVGK